MSLVSLPANLLVLIAVPYAMGWGFVAALATFLGTIVGTIVAIIPHILLWYQLTLVDLFASIPFASVAVPPIPFWMLVLMYVLVGMFVWKISQTKNIKRSS